jgi:hypothetical protein
MKDVYDAVGGAPAGKSGYAAVQAFEAGLRGMGGAQDPFIEQVRAAVAGLHKLNAPCQFVEIPQAGHSLPESAWRALAEWIPKQKPKPWSPRPLFLPPAGERPLWQKTSDPLDLEADTVTALLKGGRHREAKAALDERIGKDPGDAKNYYLRVLAVIPGLADGYPANLDPEAFGDPQRGWNSVAETTALMDLDRALRAKSGKGERPEQFDSVIHLLAARIHAKRFATNLTSGLAAWLNHYNASVKELQAALKDDPANAQAATLAQALNTRFPRPHAGAGKK